MSPQARGPRKHPMSAVIKKRRQVVTVISLALFAIVVIVTVSLANRVPDSASTAPVVSKIKVGDRAPDFSVSSTGGPFDLAVNGKSKPTLLEVFATWCPHCQREAPLLSALAKTYQGRVNVLGVAGSNLAMDHESPETQADVFDWSRRFGATYPVAFDPNLDVATKYLSEGFPTVILIGTDGKVAGIRFGEMPAGDLAVGINSLLAGKKPDPKLGMKVPAS